MRRWIAPSISLLILSGSLQAEADGLLVDRVRAGLDASYRLDHASANTIFRQLVEEYPENPVGYGMLAINAWRELLFAARNLALEEYATPTPFTRNPTYKIIDRERRRFEEANERLLKICEDRLEKDPRDVLALYFKGLHYENLAAEAIAVSKDTGAAIGAGRRARVLHEQVLDLDPEFADARISVAVHEFAKATLPWSIRWLAFLVGIRGNKDKALEQLEEVGEKGVYRNLDAQIVLALLHAWKGDPQRAAAIFEKLRLQYPENYLLDINLAAVYSEVLEEPRRALEIYQQLLADLPRKAPGLLPGEIHYRIGRTHFQLNDYSLALEAFEKTLSSSRGEQETLPLAHYHIARIYEQRGERSRAETHYRQVLSYSGPTDGLRDEINYARRRVG